ncbi:hypothetical protein [Crateriforma conspicua]|uniref:Uncharacterized protein n=1 Tax=Crateriforma conspicua TaxID=2527996 RepID=A0A5C6FU75_9PLAN|nr:hypothetical protein [Crateriforma conspicua]TWU65814.1 hypothetical protein V7x_13670 [Crateriforma conspicua]
MSDSIAPQPDVQLPDTLKRSMTVFRRRLWTLKLWEALALAVAGVLFGFFLVFIVDRFVDTPAWIRTLILIGSLAVLMVVPWAIYHWIVRRRTLHQVAELLTTTRPAIGDRLMGVIELADNADEQGRSPRLVRAAIDQVSDDVDHADLRHAIPHPMHGQRSLTAAIMLIGLGCLTGISAAATGNAWSRYLTPWSDVSRFTFTQIEPLPDQMIVAHGEAFDFDVALAGSTESRPEIATARLADGQQSASIDDEGYHFHLPGRYQEGALELSAGDYRGTTKLVPVTRPELADIEATIHLPAYLQRDEPIIQTLRGGSLSVVRGSQVELLVNTSRDLRSAEINGSPADVSGHAFEVPPQSVQSPSRLTLSWRDVHNLQPAQPFELQLSDVNDAAPTVTADGLPRHQVLLDSETIAYTAYGRDDFGIRRIGLLWHHVDDEGNLIDGGEKVIAAGRPDADLLEATGTFTAKDLERRFDRVAVQLYVEDYLPNRERVLGPISVFDVLTADEHAIWIANQLARWQRQSLDVRDRELKLYQKNSELRRLSKEQLNAPETRRQLQAQARAERANGHRLNRLVGEGESLLAQAMRNPEIGVGHMESWAEMMQVLKDISGNRMPSVADLLRKAGESESLARSDAARKRLTAGKNRVNQTGKSESDQEDEGESPAKAPGVTDVESTQLDLSEQKQPKSGPKKASSGRLSLPTTRLAGNAVSDQEPPESEPQENEIDEAVTEQDDLLAEFEKVVGELDKLMANMEGSTLVKRLKAASRKQDAVADQLTSVSQSTFGRDASEVAEAGATLSEVSEKLTGYRTDVSYIMDDMDAYYERSRYVQFKTVLDEMRSEDVTGALGQLSNDVVDQSGISVAMAEYWSDTLDRWAEDLVEPSISGSCPGGKSQKSLPPSIVLEVLQILEAEVKLRESTREAQQARPDLDTDDYRQRATNLAVEQADLRNRTDLVSQRINELPNAGEHFVKELKKLTSVSIVMTEAVGILATPETGSEAIAAETEVIELLLETKRMCQGGGGGGGGANPGGGGGGDTDVAALALVGAGLNANEVREATRTETNTGNSGTPLPEEFRSGLDQYFHQIQQWNASP